MLKTKPTVTGMYSPARRNAVSGGRSEAAAAWGLEIRPSGMLVQQRNSDSNQMQMQNPIHNLKIRVKFDSSYHDITISSQATFGEVKKMLAGATGVHPQDQKLIYKDIERDSKAFLDVAGVKNGSKLVLVADELSRERRCVELRRNSSMDRASKAISDIKIEVDKLAKQVANLEIEIFSGKKVAERLVLTFVELLMTQLINLDGIIADGDAKLQRRMQVKRVQQYIETLDVLKTRNSMLGTYGVVKQQEKHSSGQMNSFHVYAPPSRPTATTATKTKWETFESGLEGKSPLKSTSTTMNKTSKINGRFLSRPF